MNESDFVAAIERCTLPASAFRHADHVRLAWVYLRDLPLTQAIDRYTATLKRFASHHGARERYHATITWAYLLLIHERMQRDGAASDWDAFRAAHRDLLEWKPSVLERYYRAGTLESNFARKVFVLPDGGL